MILLLLGEVLESCRSGSFFWRRLFRRTWQLLVPLALLGCLAWRMCWAASRCTSHARELCGRGGKHVRRVLKYINRLGKWSWCECERRDDCFKTYIMRIFMDQPCRKASAPYTGSLGHGVDSIAQSTATHMRGPQLDGGMGCKSQLYLFPETLPVSKTSSTSLSSFTSATLRSHAALSAQVELSAAARDVISACVTSLSLGRKLHSLVGTGLLLCVAMLSKERTQKAKKIKIRSYCTSTSRVYDDVIIFQHYQFLSTVIQSSRL